jgi:O-antigen/teichoic acid export membrane protein
MGAHGSRKAVIAIARGGKFARLFGSAIIMQALLSATNLLVGLILIRHTSNTDYGMYVLVTTGGLLLSTLQSAFIQPPLVLRLSRSTLKERAELVGGVYRGQQRVWATLGIAGFVLIGILRVAGAIDNSLALLSLAAVAALSAALFREFFRMVTLSYRRADDALKADACYGAMMLIGVPLSTLFPAPAVAALLVLAISAVTGGAILSRLLRRFEPWNAHASPGLLREMFPLGSWSALGAGTHWGFSQGYNYVVAALLDVSAVAALAATRLLMMPINLLSSGISSLMMATASSWLISHGPRSLLRRLVLIALGLGALACCYFISIWFLRDWIFDHVMHKQFPHTDVLVAAWSAVFLVMLFRDQLNFFPAACAMHRQQTFITAGAAVASLITGRFVISGMGVVGAPIAVLVGEFCNVIGLLWLSRREIKRRERT